jgi:hypothetical protein
VPPALLANEPCQEGRPVPRTRAIFLLALFVANQAACTSWQVPKVTPQEYVAQHPDKKVRVTAKDEHGVWSTDAGVVLTEVRFSADSVFGRGPSGQPVAYSLSQVVTVEVRAKDGAATSLLVLALLGVGAALAVLANSLNSCPGPAC